ncbi:DUF4291 family protein [Dyella marensis]
MTQTNFPQRQIRALYNEHTLRVYQAYSHAIADSALAHQTFVSPPFNIPDLSKSLMELIYSPDRQRGRRWLSAYSKRWRHLTCRKEGC